MLVRLGLGSERASGKNTVGAMHVTTDVSSYEQLNMVHLPSNHVVFCAYASGRALLQIATQLSIMSLHANLCSHTHSSSACVLLSLLW